MKEMKHNKTVCPYCNGTGLEYEEARKLWVDKDIKDLTYIEFSSLFRQQAFSGKIKYLKDAKLKTRDIISILKKRHLWVECHLCKGKGVI